MSVRRLHGMTYRGWEVSLSVLHEPKALTREIRRILEKDPRTYLHSVSSGVDPVDETIIVYTVVVAL